MSTTKIYLLESASITVLGHQIFWINVPVEGAYRFPVYSVMIEHKEGLFMFDTGLDGALVQKFSRGDPNRMSQTKERSQGSGETCGKEAVRCRSDDELPLSLRSCGRKQALHLRQNDLPQT